MASALIVGCSVSLPTADGSSLSTWPAANIGSRVVAETTQSDAGFVVDGVHYYQIPDTTDVAVGNGMTAAIDSSESGSLIIPDRVSDGTTTYAVAQIASYAFKSCDIECVTVPASVIYIQNFAFWGCSKLATADFKNDMYWPSEGYTGTGDNTAFVGYVNQAFEGCTSLQNLVFESTPFRQVQWYLRDPSYWYSAMGIDLSKMNIYCRIDFFASKDQAEAAAAYHDGQSDTPQTPLSSALVKFQTSITSVTSALSSDSIWSGSIPELTEDQAWGFSMQAWDDDRDVNTSIVNTVTYGYVVDNDDLANASFTVSDSYSDSTLVNGKITDSVLKLASGAELTLDIDYTLSYTNIATMESTDIITKNGTYTVTATPKNPKYSGTISSTTVYYSKGAFSRIAGRDRYDLSYSIVGTVNSSAPSDYLILATGSNWQDAVTSAGLAGVKDAPIYVIPGNIQGNPSGGTWLTAAVRTKIYNTGASNIIIVGNDNAVNANIASELKTIPTVKKVDRFSGSSCSATAYDVYYKVKNSHINTDAWGDIAVVMSNSDYVGGLSISGYAAMVKAPIFMASKGNIDSASFAALARFSKVIVLGNTSAVKASVSSTLAAKGVSITRLSGSDGLATNRAICDYELSHGMTYSSILVSSISATHYSDSLSASALCAQTKSALMLTAGTTSDASRIVNSLKLHKTTITNGYVIGGTSSISPSALNELDTLWD